MKYLFALGLLIELAGVVVLWYAAKKGTATWGGGILEHWTSKLGVSLISGGLVLQLIEAVAKLLNTH